MIIVFGSVNLDLIFPLPALPGPGQTVLGPDLRAEPGGKGANQAIAAARDGAAVIFAGAVGQDDFATPATAGLHSAGIDLGRLARVSASTGVAAIAVDPAGRNQIAVAAGANRLARAAQVEDEVLGPASTLLLQMECDPDETATLIRHARGRGTRILLNLAPPRPLPADVLAALDILLVNEDEASALSARLGMAAADAASLAAKLGIAVVRTLGADGAEAAGSGERIRLPALPVKVIDTTGAGDCLAGVFAAAIDRGIGFKEALTRAIAAAGICCARAGSQGSLPTAAETDAALQQFNGENR
ncbi:MAG TPA: ribokinase [Acetobacteraceae bacterium]|nr:ribokinase [Acetobacteraceae bacterium]